MMTEHTNRNASAKSFGKVLNGAAGELSYLIEHSKRLELMSRLVQGQLPPPLGQHCRVANITQQTLIIHTDSPAWATKLRYYCPQLLAYLCQRADFGQLSDIRIKTVPPEQLQSSRQSAPRRLPASAAHLLRSVAAVISPVALKHALLRLAKRE